MADFDTQINVGMNVDGVVAGTEKAKRSVRDLGESARGAGKSLDGIGDGAGQSAQKVESATRSMIQSIQRTTAATEAGDKSTRAYQESLARLRGVDVAALKPYLDQLDSAKAKAEAAARSADSLDTSLRNIKVGAAIVAAGGAAFVAYAKNINNGLDALNDLKDATGASIENISALEDIALRASTSFDTVGSSLLKLNQVLGASKPGSDTEKAISAIGLSISDLKALDPVEAFRQIAVSLSGFSDDANKARLTQELFGKSLKDVAPLLNDVAAASKLAGTVTTEQAAAAEALNKELFALEKNATDLGRSLISDLVPAINQTIAAFRDGNSAGKGFFEIAWDRYWSNVADVYAKPEQTMEQYKSRLVEIDKTLGSGQILYVERNRLLKEQFEIQQKLANLTQFSPDNESAAESARLRRRPSVGDIGAGPTAAQISAASAAAKAARDKIYKDDIAGFKAMQDAQKDYEKALSEGVKERERYNETFEKSADSVAKQLQALQDEEQALALSASANITLASAIAEVEIARLREAQAIELSFGNDTAVAAIQREIDLRRQLATAINSKDGREAAKKAAEDAAKEWMRGWEETDRIARDVFANWDGSLRGLGDTLEKSLLSAIYEVTAKPILLDIYTSVTGGPQQGKSAGNGLNLLSGQGFAEGVSDGALKLGNNLLRSNNEYAQKVGTYLGKNSEQIGAYAEKAGAVLNYLEAASNFKDGSYGKSIGQAAGQYFFGPIGGQIGKELGSLVDKLFSKGVYVESTGNANTRFDAAGNITGRNDETSGNFSVARSAGADAVVAGLQKQYADAAKALGIGTVGGNFSFGGNNSDGGKFSLASGVGSKTFTQAETALNDDALKLAASRAVFSALQGSDLPGYLAKLFDGINASAASQADIDSALAFAGTLKQLRAALVETRTPLEVLQANVTQGFADLGTSAATFKTDFVKAIDAGISPENLAKFTTLGSQIDALAASAKQAADELARAQKATATAFENVLSSIAGFRSSATEANEAVLGSQAAIAQRYISAQDAVAQAQERVNALVLQSANNLRAFSNTIGGFLATLDPATAGGASLPSLKAQLSSTAVLAQGGDAGAQGRLIAQAQNVLQVAQANSGSAREFARSQAFVRELLGSVQKSIDSSVAGAPAESTLAQQITAANGELLAAQANATRIAQLAADTNTSILASTDVVGDEIAALRASYDTAIAAQAAADLRLLLATEALATLGLSEDGIKLAIETQLTGTAASDFAFALGIKAEDFAAIQTGLGISDEALAALGDALNVKVADAVYTQLGTALGVPSDTLAALGISLGAPAAFVESLSTSLGMNPLEFARLQTVLGLNAEDALALQAALTLSAEDRTTLSNFAGIDTSNIATLTDALGGLPPSIAALAGALDAAQGAMQAISAFAATVALDPAVSTQLEASGDSIGNSITGAATVASATLDASGNTIGAAITGAASGAATALGGAITVSGSSITALDDAGAGISRYIITAAGSAGAALAGSLSIAAESQATIDKLGAAIKLDPSVQMAVEGFGKAIGLNDSSAALLNKLLSQSASSYIEGMGGDINKAAALYSEKWVVKEIQEGLAYATPSQIIAAAKSNYGIAETDIRRIAKAAGIPGFAVGTNYVNEDMLALVHKGEAIVPAAYNPMAGGQAPGNAELVAEIRALKTAIAALQSAAESSAKSNKKTADTLTRVTRDGESLITTAA